MLSVFCFRRLISDVTWPIITKLRSTCSTMAKIFKKIGSDTWECLPQNLATPKHKNFGAFSDNLHSPDWKKLSSIGKQRFKLYHRSRISTLNLVNHDTHSRIRRRFLVRVSCKSGTGFVWYQIPATGKHACTHKVLCVD